MKLTTLILSGCFFIALINTAKAQNDYVITLNNDTLRGKITKNLFSKARFKEANQSRQFSINEKNAKVYHRVIDSTRSETFVARILPNGKRPNFMLLHEQGAIQLYELEQTTYNNQFGSTTYKTWYISKGNGPLFIIKTTALSFSREEKESNFEQLLNDNPALWAKFKAEDSFSFKKLRNYIQLYNKEKKNEI